MATQDPPNTRVSRGPLRLLKNLAIGLAPLVLLIGLTELVLSLLGVADPGEHFELSRGFDANVPFFEEDPERPGGLRMRVREGAGAAVLIPPREDAQRVFLFGGSNTHSFPEDVVETALEADTGRAWEVINLGRPGFGSERVSILLGQSVQLEPDAIVIYSGHNEFVERGFQRQLGRQMFGSGWTNDVLVMLSQLRLFRVVESILRPEEAARSTEAQEAAPDVVQSVSKEWHSTQYDETLVYYEAYRQNLRRMVRAALDRDIDVVLCTVVGNDLSPPRVSTIPKGTTSEDLARFQALRNAVRGKVPTRFVKGMRPPVRVGVWDWGLAIKRSELKERLAAFPDPIEPSAMRTLRGPLGKTPATEGPKTKSIEGAHFMDPRSWTPDARLLHRTSAALYEPGLDDDEREGLQEAAALLDQALEIIPDHPDTLWDSGLCAYVLGDDVLAARMFSAAASYDRAPRRGNPVTNAIVREVAEEFPEVELMDMALIYSLAHPDGIVGYEVMTDVCHLQPGARIYMAQLMAQGVRNARAR